MYDDTIAAVATAMGEGGIGIVRVSGEKAFSILEKVFAVLPESPALILKIADCTMDL